MIHLIDGSFREAANKSGNHKALLLAEGQQGLV